METETIEETRVIEMNNETKTTEELREDLRQILGSKLEIFLTTFNSELEKNGFILDVETVSSSKGRFNRMVIFDK
jgi:hypothetical protein